MAIDLLGKKEKQKKLVIVLVVILLVTFVIVIVGLSRKKEESTVRTGTTEINPEFRININLDIFNNPIFEELETFNKIQPLEGIQGRENPFISY